MKNSFISLLIAAITVIFLSGIAESQPPLAENTDSEVMKHSEKTFSNLVFIPSYYDFQERNETTVQTYGFQLKNLGATIESGQVFVYGDQPFSCVSSCSFSLDTNESQYVHIEFAPCEIPYLLKLRTDCIKF